MRQGGQYVFFITVCLLRMTIFKVAALSVYQRQNRLAPSGINGNIYFQGKAAYMRGTSSIICEGQVVYGYLKRHPCLPSETLLQTPVIRGCPDTEERKRTSG